MKTKKLCINFVIIFLIISFVTSVNLINYNNKVYAKNEPNNFRSSVLIEQTSGKVLVDNNSNERHPIASVTKLMTILLTLENIEAGNLNLEDKILVSENASGMGGSQIFLDANQEYSVEQLLKSVIIASANDSSVALAEQIAGSENNFVKTMNEKASYLGLINTHYANCTGLPSAEGYSSAYDQAIILKQVLSYDLYHTYSAIWMEDFVHPSGRITQMTNTNKLSRYYEGCTGGKTGSTNQAKYCLAVGAQRNNMNLIAVVLGAENSQTRFKTASDLLNHGFENYTSKTIFSDRDLLDKTIKIKGQDRVAHLKAEKDYTIVSKIGEEVNFSLNYNLPSILLEVSENEVVGNVEIIVDGKVMDTINILSCDSFEKANIWDYFKEIIEN